jgi:hypothetical protein
LSLREPQDVKMVTTKTIAIKNIPLCIITKFNANIGIKLELIKDIFSEQRIKEIKLHDSGTAFSLKNQHLSIEIRNFMATQIDLKKKLHKKIHVFAEASCLVTQKAFEQATGSSVAKFKASYFENSFSQVVDLTGGLGVETYYWAKQGKKVLYIEQDECLFQLSKFNFDRLGIKNQVSMSCGNSMEFINKVSENALIIADPDRRGLGDARILSTEEFLPNPIQIWDSLRSENVFILIKLPPIIDITYVQNTFKDFNEIIVISHKNEVKEVGVWKMPGSYEKKLTAINIDYLDIPHIYTCNLSNLNSGKEVQTEEYHNEQYLIYPSKAIIKAGLSNQFAQSNELKVIERQLPLYFTNNLSIQLDSIAFEVILHNKYNPKSFSRFLKQHSIKRANLISFSHRLTPISLENKNKLPPGSDYYFFFYLHSATQKHYYFCCKKLNS